MVHYRLISNMKYYEKKFTPALAFNVFTSFFDTIIELLGFGRSFKRNLLKMLDIKEQERILDVGCGTGTLLLEIKSKYPNTDITGIDADPKVLRIANNKIDSVGISARLVEGLAQDLPFPSNYFTLVVSTLIFHHLKTETKKEAIREIFRVLKDDGRFLLADFGKPVDIKSQILLNIGSIFDGKSNMRDNLAGKLPLFLQEAGFRVTELGSRYRGVQFLMAKK